MAHSTVILDKRSQKKDGTYPIKIRISHKGEFYIGVGVNVLKHQWQDTFDDKGKRIKASIVVNHPLAQRFNNLISSRKLEIDRKLLNLADSRQILKMDCHQLKNHLTKEDESPAYLFKIHYDKYVGRLTRSSSISSLHCMYSKMSGFCDTEKLTFEKINYLWLKEFDSFMEDGGLSINARGVYMRNIKAIFNDAIKCDCISLALYPFLKFKIQKEATRKRSLTVDQLRVLKDYECQKHQIKSRDIFMLTFYLIGINMIDLLDLKEIVNGRIEYSRSKTGRLYSITVPGEAMEIIDKYKGRGYLIDPMDAHKNYKDFLRRTNTNLRNIGILEWVDNNASDPKKVKANKKRITPVFPDLTTYWARHTWATIAAEIDIPDETISLALGHAGPNAVTNIYINRDQRKVDEANRRVIDYVFGK